MKLFPLSLLTQEPVLTDQECSEQWKHNRDCLDQQMSQTTTWRSTYEKYLKNKPIPDEQYSMFYNQVYTTANPFKLEINGQVIAYTMRAKHVAYSKGDLWNSIKRTHKCNECSHRGCDLYREFDENGPIILNQSCYIGSGYEQVFKTRRELFTNISSYKDLEVVMVNTPKSGKLYPTPNLGFCGNPAIHSTVEYNQVTPTPLVAKWEQLKHYTETFLANRISKLLSPDYRNYINEVLLAVKTSQRAGLYEKCCDWVLSIISEAGDKTFEQLTPVEQMQLLVKALMTGRSDGTCHTEVQQSSNIIDFVDKLKESNFQALIRLIDERGNPDTYQQSQVARALNIKNVSSMNTVSLSWGGELGPNKSDLDLHVEVTFKNGHKEVIYFSNPKSKFCLGTKLDFDANAGKVEKEPVENISIGDKVHIVQIFVNNYYDRDYKNIPFALTIRREGFPDIVEEFTWLSSWGSGSNNKRPFMKPIDFTEKHPQNVETMSAALCSRTKTHTAELASITGKYESIYTTTSDISRMDNTVSVTSPRNTSQQSQPTMFDFLSGVTASLGGASLGAATGGESSTSFTSPTNVPELYQLIEDGTEMKLTVKSREMSQPCYLVGHTGIPDDFLHSTVVPVVYQEKFKNPIAPSMLSRNGGSARLYDWVNGKFEVSITHIIKFGDGYLFVVDNVELPNDSDYPKTSMHNPQNVRSKYHHLKDMWTASGAVVKPIRKTHEPLVAGFFWSGQQLEIALNGRSLTLNSSSFEEEELPS